MPFTISDEYGYVLMAASSTCLVSWVHSSITTKWRHLSGFEYPTAYAPDSIAAKNSNAATFNCAQRAHANFTENHVSFLGLLMVAGLKYPMAAACLGFGWTFTRIAYVYGYTSKGPKGRHPWFSGAGLISAVIAALAGYSSYSFALRDGA